MRLLVLSIIFSVPFWARAQDDTTAPYRKFKGFPPVQLLQADSSSFTKEDLPRKKPVVLIIFNPECEHCQHETESIVAHIEKFEEITILMVTSRTLEDVRAFRNKYQLGRFENFILCRDPRFFLISYFGARTLPFLAFFDKKLELISVHPGILSAQLMLEELKK